MCDSSDSGQARLCKLWIMVSGHTIDTNLAHPFNAVNVKPCAAALLSQTIHTAELEVVFHKGDFP